MKLKPEEQILWSLSQGYFLYELLDVKEKKIFNGFRNGWKKYIREKNS